MSFLGDKQVIVIDNGTGYTKMGYSGNSEPSFICPTAIATAEEAGIGGGAGGSGAGIGDLDFYTGDEALSHSRSYSLSYPIRGGLIESWSGMEKLWQRCFYDYLRVEPEEHFVLLTEPPLNPPENRELTAEIMFETFGVPGLYIAVQAVLALAASWANKRPEERVLTGTVVDSGDGVTHVIPVAEGYVIGSCIRSIPLAGRDITTFIQRSLRERGEPVPPEESLEIAKRIKERYCYCCQDMVKEFSRFDTSPAKMFKRFTGSRTASKGDPITVDVGYEAFLGPELFFNPEIYSSDYTKPLSQVVDESILGCPLDSRKALYSNIVLSGGSTLFPNFAKRLQGEIKDRVQTRIEANWKKHKAAEAPPEMKVKVHSHDMQRYAVWFGGSMLSASQAEFKRVCHTKQQYFEEGPRIARHNAVFSI